MDQEQKYAGSMKSESLKERGLNTTDISLLECEGGNALHVLREQTINCFVII